MPVTIKKKELEKKEEMLDKLIANRVFKNLISPAGMIGSTRGRHQKAERVRKERSIKVRHRLSVQSECNGEV